MSFQAIIDNFVSPQIADLQLSNTVKESQKTSNSFSFSDLVASYKDESKVENKPAENSFEKKVENSNEEVKSLFEEQEKVESTEEKVQTKNDEPKTEEKVEQKLEKLTSTSEKTSKKIEITQKTEVKNPKIEEKKAEIKDSKVSAGKENQKTKKENKLGEKDFARIAEIENQNNENLQSNASVKKAENQKIPEQKKDAEKEDNNETIATLQNQIEPSETLMNITAQSSKEDSDFEKDGSKQKNVAKLDKDGKITVEDLRTEKNAEPVKNEKTNLKVTDVKFNNDNTATITMDLNQADNNVLSLNDQSAASQGSNFQSMLNNQIQANVPEFVKAGNIILKDNDQGTINLVLHPDDLGNVKIHLSMDGKNVTGHITVATKEALEVFKDNAQTMREAFIKSGFENASFDVAYGNMGSGNQGMNFEQQQDGSNLVAQHVYNSSKGLESSDSFNDDYFTNDEKFNDFSINIVA